MTTTKAKAVRMLQHPDGGECKKVGSFLRSQCITAESRLSIANTYERI